MLWLLLAKPTLLAAGPVDGTADRSFEGAATRDASGVADSLADPASDLKVTVYRAPSRRSGSIDLEALQGFALVSETRTVRLAAGETRVRFEGVADGIEPASTIIVGLQGAVLEKNRDARLLSPAALIASAVGRPVELLRTDRKTGRTVRLPGTLESNADGGVVFKTAQGIEALRCSGLAETFQFTSADGRAAHPTLSVLVRSPRAMTQRVTLSYLSRGFDWAADYTATLSQDATHLDLGAWITLANSNGVGFPAAHMQVVAGRLNREHDEVDPIGLAGPILATCWPQGSTSDQPMLLRREGPRFAFLSSAVVGSQALGGVPAPAAKKVEQEQLGDLKLYRVPERTTLASRQSKQVRLLDRSSIPVQIVYGADLPADAAATSVSAYRVLRTTNTAANDLGLPLPSGTVAVFAMREGRRLLERESGMTDTAVSEAVELDMGSAPDVEVSAMNEPGADAVHTLNRVEIRNARASAILFELRLSLRPGESLVRADAVAGAKNGRPLFTLTVPANGSATLRYETQQSRRGRVGHP